MSQRSDWRPKALLHLLFEIGDEAYALETGCVFGLLPFAETIEYDDKPVPVIDLCFIVHGRSAARRFSTRIVLIEHVFHGETFVLGLVVERATQTTRQKPADILPARRDASALLARNDINRRLTEAMAHASLSKPLAAGGNR